MMNQMYCNFIIRCIGYIVTFDNMFTEEQEMIDCRFDLSIYRVNKLLYIYIYIYICMYVCMYITSTALNICCCTCSIYS